MLSVLAGVLTGVFVAPAAAVTPSTVIPAQAPECGNGSCGGDEDGDDSGRNPNQPPGNPPGNPSTPQPNPGNGGGGGDVCTPSTAVTDPILGPVRIGFTCPELRSGIRWTVDNTGELPPANSSIAGYTCPAVTDKWGRRPALGYSWTVTTLQLEWRDLFGNVISRPGPLSETSQVDCINPNRAQYSINCPTKVRVWTYHNASPANSGKEFLDAATKQPPVKETSPWKANDKNQWDACPGVTTARVRMSSLGRHLGMVFVNRTQVTFLADAAGVNVGRERPLEEIRTDNTRTAYTAAFGLACTTNGSIYSDAESRQWEGQLKEQTRREWLIKNGGQALQQLEKRAVEEKFPDIWTDCSSGDVVNAVCEDPRQFNKKSDANVVQWQGPEKPNGNTPNPITGKKNNTTDSASRGFNVVAKGNAHPGTIRWQQLPQLLIPEPGSTTELANNTIDSVSWKVDTNSSPYQNQAGVDQFSLTPQFTLVTGTGAVTNDASWWRGSAGNNNWRVNPYWTIKAEASTPTAEPGEGLGSINGDLPIFSTSTAFGDVLIKFGLGNNANAIADNVMRECVGVGFTAEVKRPRITK